MKTPISMMGRRIAVLAGVSAVAATCVCMSAAPAVAAPTCVKTVIAQEGDTGAAIAARAGVGVGKLVGLDVGLNLDLGLKNILPDTKVRAGTKVCVLQ